jgi:outer membrane immunogenic protein
MKRFLLATTGVALLAGLASANAADLGRRAAVPYKAPAYVAQVYNWTGFYLGVNGGGAWGRSSLSGFPGIGDYNVSGGLIGGTAGYNIQMGQAVFGLEGDIDWSNVRGSTACGVAISCETRNTWLSTVRGRVGYSFDRILPYVTGGLALGDIRTTATGFSGASSNQAGWTVGGGAEFAIAGPWTAKVEYLYVDLGSMNCGLSCGGVASNNVKLQENVVRGGVNYRF